MGSWHHNIATQVPVIHRSNLHYNGAAAEHGLPSAIASHTADQGWSPLSSLLLFSSATTAPAHRPVYADHIKGDEFAETVVIGQENYIPGGIEEPAQFFRLGYTPQKDTPESKPQYCEDGIEKSQLQHQLQWQPAQTLSEILYQGTGNDTIQYTSPQSAEIPMDTATPAIHEAFDKILFLIP